MLAQFPIARAFGVDACGAVLCSGDRAPRHHQAATRLVARSIGRCTDGRGGFAQGGKQQPAAGRGGVGLPAEGLTGDTTYSPQEEHSGPVMDGGQRRVED
jgi:hypothetical protein